MHNSSQRVDVCGDRSVISRGGSDESSVPPGPGPDPGRFVRHDNNAVCIYQRIGEAASRAAARNAGYRQHQPAVVSEQPQTKLINCLAQDPSYL
jgi:hypothetical protein